MQTISFENQLIAPSKIVCIGRNYVEHIKELANEIPDEMVIFNKPNSAISNELNAFHQEEQLHYEAELCFLFQGGKFIAVGFGLDLTKRGLQGKLKTKGLPWERAKSFDGSAVFSEFVTIDDIGNSLTLELTIDDKLIQQGGVELMMHKPQQILTEITRFMTLEDGDVVMTGTPKGVGVIENGAHFSAKVLLNGETLLSETWQAN